MRARNPFELLPGLKRSALFTLECAVEIVADRFSRMDSNHGLTTNEVWVLMASEERNIHQGLLAECIGINKNTMVRLINRAEKKGLVRRVENPVDRREALIKTTRKGKRILGEILEVQRESWLKAFFPLSMEEIDRELAVLSRIIDAHHRKKRRRK